ncbi:MAG: DUF1996 domain-containing protein [Phycicoccus sp.]
MDEPDEPMTSRGRTRVDARTRTRRPVGAVLVLAVLVTVVLASIGYAATAPAAGTVPDVGAAHAGMPVHADRSAGATPTGAAPPGDATSRSAGSDQHSASSSHAASASDPVRSQPAGRSPHAVTAGARLRSENLPPVSVQPAAGAPDVGFAIADVRCEFSHRKADDPLVFFQQHNASHLHDFVGNTTTDASSTAARMRGGRTTCATPKDTSGYWFPTVSRNGKDLTPEIVDVYYLNALKGDRMVAPPTGFRMISGDATGVEDAVHAGSRYAGFTCGGDEGDFMATIPQCGDRGVTMKIQFPDCWDGRNLYRPDQGHVAFSTFSLASGNFRCPASHPVSIPQIRVNAHYPQLRDASGVRLSTATGGLDTVHADVFNGWEPAALRQVVDGLNTGRGNPLPGILGD